VRKVITLLGFFIASSAAQAQLGPTAARAIVRPMPSKAPSAQTFNAEAELVVSRKGRIDSVEVITSSGDPAFDKAWRNTLEEWRFVPAIDAQGQPIESRSRVTYKNSGLSERPSSADGAAPPNVITESERLARMTCNDFLWEYYIVTNALPRRLALMDPLLKAPLVTYFAEANPNEAQQQALRSRYDQLVDDAAKLCRDNPESAFWTGVFKPVLDGAVAN
jgi:TonB family protein